MTPDQSLDSRNNTSTLQGVNIVINKATLQNTVRNWNPLKPLWTAQLLLPIQTNVGSLILRLPIISLPRSQIYNFTLNMMVLMKLLLEMDQVCPLLIPILLLFHFRTENFKLKILCVPTINKNLISVHHYTKQNNVILEFHPTYFLAKDWRTGEILLQGPCENGVYPLPSSPVATPIAFVHERTSVAGWHQRLGHPSFKVVTRLISSSPFPPLHVFLVLITVIRVRPIKLISYPFINTV